MQKTFVLSAVIISTLFLSGNLSKETEVSRNDICTKYLDVPKDYVARLKSLVQSDEVNFSRYLELEGSAAPIGQTREELSDSYDEILGIMKETRDDRIRKCRVAISNGVCTEEDISLFTVVFKKASMQIKNAKVIDDLLGLEDLTYPAELSAQCKDFFEH